MKISMGPMATSGALSFLAILLVGCSEMGEPLGPVSPKPSRMRYLARSAAVGMAHVV